MNILKPLFNVVAEITTTTDIPLHFNVDTHVTKEGSRVKFIGWWIGDKHKTIQVKNGSWFDDPREPVAGDLCSYIYVDDIDEDKLDRWVAELTEFIAEPEDAESGESSIEEDHARELEVFNRTQA